MNVLVLAGGTGGAKLAHGFQLALPDGDATVVVNTGDDVERHGLLVMPDHDAILYMLTGTFDDDRGWGVAGETWTVIDALAEYGEETWFRLGDHDFATHIARGARMRAGATLTEAVLDLQGARGVPTAILPMSDEPVRTQVRTDDGWLDFQDYFVRLRQAPEVREVRFDGIERARPTAVVAAAFQAADVIVIGPSNPIVSIGPILAVPGIGDAARGRALAWCPGRRGEPDHRRQGAQGPRRPDARLARLSGRAPWPSRACCGRRSMRSCSTPSTPSSNRRSPRWDSGRSRPTR